MVTHPLWEFRASPFKVCISSDQITLTCSMGVSVTPWNTFRHLAFHIPHIAIPLTYFHVKLILLCSTTLLYWEESKEVNFFYQTQTLIVTKCHKKITNRHPIPILHYPILNFHFYQPRSTDAKS